jgi:predicted CXXCH cytochrome family protein
MCKKGQQELHRKFTQFSGFAGFKNSKISANSINILFSIICSIFLILLCFPLFSEARVTGVCSNCHTMHNSQNGQAVVAEGPQECLLNRAGCLGCHGQGTAQNIITNGNIPQVLHTNATDLAGGNFAYITDAKVRIPSGEDFKRVGHNVIDLGSAYKDTQLASPPGDEQGTGITNDNFTCSGAKGCHGDRTVEDKLLSLKGAHHTDDGVLKFGSISESGQGDNSTGLSYRFLKDVYGGEDTDWQATTGSTDHNEYKGATSGVEVGDAYTPGGNTISGFCAECHGNFHGGSADIGGPTGTPWLRHPTDISLPGIGEYIAYTSYDLTVPVARVNIPSSPQPDVSDTNDIVMCLSCHRAHASPYFKMMRWDYKGWPGNDEPNYCAMCHSSKQ